MHSFRVVEENLKTNMWRCFYLRTVFATVWTQFEPQVETQNDVFSATTTSSTPKFNKISILVTEQPVSLPESRIRPGPDAPFEACVHWQLLRSSSSIQKINQISLRLPIFQPLQVTCSYLYVSLFVTMLKVSVRDARLVTITDCDKIFNPVVYLCEWPIPFAK